MAASEASIQRAIQRELRLRGFWIRKLHGGPFSVAGDPDLLAIRHGRAFALEVKRPGEKPAPIQLRRLEELEAAGAVVGVVHSVEEAVALVS